MTAPLIGVAGWALSRDLQPQFAPGDSHLARYASRFDVVEINSSFYRPHRRATYQRWAATVPDEFRFAAKLPRTITHERRLVAATALLDAFLQEVGGLGEKLGVLLIQLPPTLAFDAPHVSTFLQAFRARHFGTACVEPRHASWFTAAAGDMLANHHIARVAADPAVVPAASEPGGDPSLCYLRLHGSPRMYYSAYDDAQLDTIASQLDDAARHAANTWCIFDNTADGHAIPNALALRRRLRG
ncbi:MAG TPA: DUF72 domain-containing protein [Tahibacter sp.]|uniref:DUF72 domain-containing protein n=1 Tax=Tahibacter sp. TaxID=2056211 RepID=UPI002C1D58F1|nr:DUF72 domain-containing protein [Tahibacter sp.]HSX58644.1 DUF72 domain-containing protein [Tahibacter sp.]